MFVLPGQQSRFFEQVVDGRGRNVGHKPQLDGDLGEQPHRPVVMSLGRGATGHSDQVGGL
jgi:hypothetical protein